MSESALSIIDPTEPLVEMCKSTRQAYYEVARTRSRVTAAIVRAQALQNTLQAAQTPGIAAMLLAMSDPSIKMVETVGEVSDPERVRIMALALWFGFTPGDAEFSIFASRNGANLYIKANGYKTLLTQLGAKEIRIQPGFPKQINFKEGGAAWIIEGTAECVYDGQRITLQFSDKGAVKVPCNLYRGQTASSDNLDAIGTKAERRMAKALYAVVQTAAKVAAAEDAEDDASGNADVTITPVQQRLAAPKTVQAAPAETALDLYLRELAGDVAEYIRDLHQLLTTSQTMKDLEETAQAFRKAIEDYKLSERICAEFRRVYSQRKGELSSV
jgi:hypothetical protein